jgi:hypothetical protein
MAVVAAIARAAGTAVAAAAVVVTVVSTASVAAAIVGAVCGVYYRQKSGSVGGFKQTLAMRQGECVCVCA